jgi:hypothetical protein
LSQRLGQRVDVPTHPLADAWRRAVVGLSRKRGVDLAPAGVDVEHLTGAKAARPIERWPREGAQA